MKEAKKKPNIHIAGRQKFSSMKEYLTALVQTMGELHNDTIKRVAKGRK